VQESARLVQISDLHIREQPGDILASGLITDHSLARVLADILSREGPDRLVLVTGDLVQEPVREAYSRLRQILRSFPFRYLCLPGNHDDPDLMRSALSGPQFSTSISVDLGAWEIVALDSTVPGAAHGRLGAGEMEKLHRQLSRRRDNPVLLGMHHHPVAVKSPWLDRMALADCDELFGTVAEAGRVRAILFGHVHQTVETTHRGVRMLGTPSTCVQFEPWTLTLNLDRLGPAWRWLDLHPDGTLDTGVRHLDVACLAESA
jgi:Icc protein